MADVCREHGISDAALGRRSTAGPALSELRELRQFPGDFFQWHDMVEQYTLRRLKNYWKSEKLPSE
jgi:hypothetical protein